MMVINSVISCVKKSCLWIQIQIFQSKIIGKNIMLMAMFLIFILNFAGLIDNKIFVAQAADIKFTQTARMWPMSTGYNQGDEVQMAKFDIAIENRWNFPRISNNTWAAIKLINPNSEIYVYQEGTKTYNSTEDQNKYPLMWLNSIARWNNARGHSMGNLNIDNADLFLLNNNSQRIEDLPSWPNSFKMDFGSEKFLKYWLEATTNDIIYQAWKADGVFLDDCLAVQGATTYSTLSKYNSDVTWIKSMNSFIQSVTSSLHKLGQKVMVNRLGSGIANGHVAWIDLDNSDTPPDVVMEEIAFIRENANFYPEEVWKLQVDLLAKIHRSKVLYNTYTNLKVGQSQLDPSGKYISYWDLLWYAWASFQLGKNNIDNNSYFSFTDKTNNINWYDEYSIDMGNPMSSYQKNTYNSKINIYWREFDKGFVYVNPTNNDVFSITLPQNCVQFTHDNIYNINKVTQTVSSFNLPAYRAAIFLKLYKVVPQNLQGKGTPE